MAENAIVECIMVNAKRWYWGHRMVYLKTNI